MHDLDRYSWLPEDFEKIERLACVFPQKPEICEGYLNAYKKLKNPNWQNQSHYHQVSCFHSNEKDIHLSALGDLFMEVNRPRKAISFYAESLRFNPKSKNVYQKLMGLWDIPKVDYLKSEKENKYKVTVVTPMYNRVHESKDSIESVLNQTLQDFEYIIINDCGDREIGPYVKQFKSDKIKYIELTENVQAPAARNHALEEAQGEYIAYIDDDDYMYPTHLESLVKTIEKNKGVAAYCNTQILKGNYDENFNFNVIGEKGYWQKEYSRDDLCETTYFVPASVMHKRSLLKEIGLFEPQILSGEDWEMWLRIALKYDWCHDDHFTTQWRHKADNWTLLNRASNDLFGEVISRYYATMQGKVAIAKHFLSSGEMSAAKKVAGEIFSQYDTSFKPLYALEELIDIACAVKNREILSQITRDCYHRRPRTAIRKMLQKKSTMMGFDILSAALKK